jgi:hypothetical protein
MKNDLSVKVTKCQFWVGERGSKKKVFFAEHFLRVMGYCLFDKGFFQKIAR